MEEAPRGIETALAVEPRPERGSRPTRVAHVGLVDVPDEALEIAARQDELHDLALGERLLGRFVEGGDVQDARGPEERRFHGEPQAGIGRGVVPPVPPTDFDVLGRGKIGELRPEPGREVGAVEHDPGVPSVADDVDPDSRFRRGRRDRPRTRRGASAEEEREPGEGGGLPPAHEPAGNSRTKRAPRPSSDSTRTDPPWRRMRCFTIERPSPVPPISFDRAPSTR